MYLIKAVAVPRWWNQGGEVVDERSGVRGGTSVALGLSKTLDDLLHPDLLGAKGGRVQ